MIEITLPIAPVAKARARITSRGAFTPAKTRQFEAHVGRLLRAIISENLPMLGPLKLTARFILRRPARPKHRTHPVVRPDTDNFVKALSDAANGILWADDSQLVHIDARKLYDASGGQPRIEMKVEEL